MNPRVISVEVHLGFRLVMTFTNGEVRQFDASPYLTYPAFERLREESYFALARQDHGTVAWPDGTDFSPDTLYLESRLISGAGNAAE